MRNWKLTLWAAAISLAAGWALFAPAAGPLRQMMRSVVERLYDLAAKQPEMSSASESRGAGRGPLQPTSGAPTEEIYSQSYALLIGNDAYDAGYPRLNQAVADVEAMRSYLVDDLGWKSENVIVRRDLEFAPGTSDDLRTVIAEFLYNTSNKPNARVFVWYSGHGERVRNTGYIVPTNAPRLPNFQFFTMAFGLDDIEPMLLESKARHIFMVFDSCFSGSIIERTRGAPTPTPSSPRMAKPARQFLTSGDAGETVLDDGEFRKLFLDLIRSGDADRDDDGLISASEISSEVALKYPSLSRLPQTPQPGRIRGVEWKDGEFFFPCLGCSAPTPSADRYEALRADVDAWIDVEAAASQEQAAAALRAYLDAFPSGVFALIAQNRIEVLLGQAVAPLISQFDAILKQGAEDRVEIYFRHEGDQAASLDIFVDNVRLVPIGDVDALPADAESGMQRYELALNPWETQLEAVFVNKHGTSPQGTRIFRRASSPSFAGARNAPNDDKPTLRALVIGIDDYASPNIPDIRGATRDARVFADLLQEQSAQGGIYKLVEVATLFDAEATRENILKALAELKSAAHPEDTVIFYFSGLSDRMDATEGAGQNRGAGRVGSQQLSYSRVDDSPNLTARLIPHDGTIRNDAAVLVPVSPISATELNYLLLGAPGRKVLFFDTPHAAGFASRNRERLGYVFYAAAAEDQLIYDSKFDGNGPFGVFSYSLAKGARGAADVAPRDGVISIRELSAYVNSAVSELGLRQQTPVTIIPTGMPDQPLFTVPPEKNRTAESKSVDAPLAAEPTR